MPCSTMRRTSLSVLASMSGRETVRATVPVITSGISTRLPVKLSCACPNSRASSSRRPSSNATNAVNARSRKPLLRCTLPAYLPAEHWSRIRTNNLTERVDREIRRRTRAIGAFPDGNSALMLVCARLRHVAASEWGSKRYMDMEHLFKMEIDQPTDEENPYI